VKHYQSKKKSLVKIVASAGLYGLFTAVLMVGINAGIYFGWFVNFWKYLVFSLEKVI